jgi:hypothetical protein
MWAAPTIIGGYTTISLRFVAYKKAPACDWRLIMQQPCL